MREYINLHKDAQSSYYGEQLRVIQHGAQSITFFYYTYMVSTIRDRNFIYVATRLQAERRTSVVPVSDGLVPLISAGRKKKRNFSMIPGSTIAETRSPARRVPRPSVDPRTTVDQSMYKLVALVTIKIYVARCTSQSTSVYDFVQTLSRLG